MKLRITETSVRWEKEMGFSHKESIGKPLVEFFVSDEVFLHESEFDRIRNSAEEFTHYCTLKAAGGARRKFQINASFVKDENDAYFICHFIPTQDKSGSDQIYSSNHIKLALSGANAGLFISDLDKKMTIWDQKSSELFGFENKSKITEDEFFQIVHPDDRSLLKELDGQGIQSKLDNTFRVIHPNGEVRFINELALLEYDEKGNPYRIIGVNIDVTEKQNYREKITQQNQAFNLALEGANAGTFIYDYRDEISFHDEHTANIMGLGSEVSSHSMNEFLRIVHPDDRHIILNTDISKEKTDITYRIILPNGKVKYINAKGIIERDTKGEPLRCVGINFDITDAYLQQQKVAESEERFRILHESSDIGTAVYSPEGEVLYINKVAAKRLGSDDPKDFINKNIYEFLDENWVKKVRTRLKETLKSDKKLTFEDYYGSGNSPQYLITHFSPFVVNGEVKGIQITAEDITELKNKELALQESETNYKSLAEFSGDYIMKFDSEGRYLYMNDIGLRESHLSKEELYGKNHIDIIGDNEYARKYVRLIKEVYKTKESRSDLIIWEQGDGKVKYLDWRLYPELDENGKVKSVLGVSRDITELKEAESILKENEANLQKAFDIAIIGSWSYDIKNDEFDWSDRCKEIIGFDKVPMPTDWKGFQNAFHPSEREDIVNAFEKSWQTGHFQIEHRFAYPDGSTKWVKVHSTTEYDSDGQPDKAIGVVQDVNEQKSAEIMLIESEKRYRKLVNSSPSILYQLDYKNRRDLYYSDQISTILGYSTYELLRNKNLIINSIHPEDRPTVENAFRALDDGKLFTLEYRIKTKDQRYIWLKDIAINTEEVNGKQILTGIAFDITKEKEYEERLNMALASASMGVFDLDTLSGEVELSDGLLDLLGYSREEMPSDFLSLLKKVLHTSDYQKSLQVMEATFAGEVDMDLSVDFRLVKKDKSIMWVSTTARIIDSTEDEKPLRIIGTIQDITKSKNQELTIKKSNQQLNNIIKSVPGAVFRRTIDGKEFEFISEQIEELTGYAAREFTPAGEVVFNQLIVESERELIKKSIDQAIRKQTAYEISYRITTKHGEERWIWERGSLITIGDERIAEGIMADITDKVNAEDRLISATLQAEDSERRRISKEIHDGVQQTLISSLISFQTIRDHVYQVENQRALNIYENAIKMLQDGLDETKMIAYSIMPKSIQDFGLVKTLESMLQTLSETTEVEFNFIENLKGEKLDNKIETSLYRICQEAVNNILKYADADEASVQLIRNSDSIVFSIEDNGVGFDINDEQFMYSGLGISSMKSRASAISATMDFSSQLGKGTSIVLEIPYKTNPN